MSDNDPNKIAAEIREKYEAVQKSNEALGTRVKELEAQKATDSEKMESMEKARAEDAEALKSLDKAVKEAKVDATIKEHQDNREEITVKSLNQFNAALVEKGEEVLTLKEALDYTKAWEISYMGKKSQEIALKGASSEVKERVKAFSRTDTGGNRLVPPPFAAEIENVSRDISDFAPHARTIRTNIGVAQRILQSTASTGYNADDVMKRAGDGSPSSIKQDVIIHNLLSVQEVPMGLLEDFGFSVSEFLTRPLAMDMALAMDTAYLGDGTTAGQGRGDANNEPTSIYSDSANFGATVPTFAATNYLGRFPRMLSGTADSLFGSNGAGIENFNLLIGKIPTRFRAMSRWFISPETLALIRSQRGSDGHFLVPNQMEMDGVKPMLFGKPVSLCEVMPNEGAGQFPVLFACLYDAYTIAMARGMTMETDRVSQFPARRFLFSLRHGGGAFNPQAGIFLKSDDA